MSALASGDIDGLQRNAIVPCDHGGQECHTIIWSLGNMNEPRFNHDTRFMSLDQNHRSPTPGAGVYEGGRSRPPRPQMSSFALIALRARVDEDRPPFSGAPEMVHQKCRLFALLDGDRR